jgi:hypothetical protein
MDGLQDFQEKVKSGAQKVSQLHGKSHVAAAAPGFAMPAVTMPATVRRHAKKLQRLRGSQNYEQRQGNTFSKLADFPAQSRRRHRQIVEAGAFMSMDFSTTSLVMNAPRLIGMNPLPIRFVGWSLSRLPLLPSAVLIALEVDVPDTARLLERD